MVCARLQLLVCAVILVIVPVSSGQLKNSCRTSSLPSGAKALLDAKYADWRPNDVSDLGADDKGLWTKPHPKDCPGIAIGHFEEPERLSYAVLLVPQLGTQAWLPNHSVTRTANWRCLHRNTSG